MVRKRSCPAVSQICSLSFLSSRGRDLILKSMLRLFVWVGGKGRGENEWREGREDDGRNWIYFPDKLAQLLVISLSATKPHYGLTRWS